MKLFVNERADDVRWSDGLSFMWAERGELKSEAALLPSAVQQVGAFLASKFQSACSK